MCISVACGSATCHRMKASEAMKKPGSGPPLLKIAFVLAGITLLFALLPVDYFILPSMRLKHEFRPKMFLSQIQSYNDEFPTPFMGITPNISIGPLGFLAIISPGSPLPHSMDSRQVIQWYDENEIWMNKTISKYGGVLLRNFNLHTPIDFDNLIGHIHPDITTDIYLGTTPRHRVNGTRFVFTASEAPRFVSIPTHIELSFSPLPPERIYFYASIVNPAPGGQTPLTDFRQVWRDLSPSLKSKMKTKGLAYERWYRHEKNHPIDPLVHKTWSAPSILCISSLSSPSSSLWTGNRCS
jgi:hypothetical protein